MYDVTLPSIIRTPDSIMQKHQEKLSAAQQYSLRNSKALQEASRYGTTKNYKT